MIFFLYITATEDNEHTPIRTTYVPSHLYHMVFELLKVQCIKYIYVIYLLGGPYHWSVLKKKKNFPRSENRPETEGGKLLRPRENIFSVWIDLNGRYLISFPSIYLMKFLKMPVPPTIFEITVKKKTTEK